MRLFREMDAAAEHINYVLPRFEEKGLRVIYVQDVDEGDGVVPGTPKDRRNLPAQIEFFTASVSNDHDIH